METWLIENWQWILIGFYVAEKVVKLTPFSWDDILVDGLKAVFGKLGRKQDALV